MNDHQYNLLYLLSVGIETKSGRRCSCGQQGASRGAAGGQLGGRANEALYTRYTRELCVLEHPA